MEAIYLQSSLQFGETLKSVSDSDYRRLRDNYDALLKQPLKLGFFVPCDENGNVWKFPPTNEEWEWAQKDSADAEQSYKMKQFYYLKAKERVLFKGFEIEDIGLGLFAIRKNGWILMRCSKSIGAKWENRDAYLNIESLTHFKLELTDSAIKQIGL